MKYKIVRFVTSLILGFTLAITQMSSAHAAGFVVDDTSDAVDANPGDGICATSTGTCTLRAAVMESNALPGDDFINLPTSTYILSIPRVSGSSTDEWGSLYITDNLTIIGSGATNTIIDGNGSVVQDVVVGIQSNITVYISGVTIRGGSSVEGGGIVNLGELTVTDSIISGNTATVSYGGGIFNHELGRLILNNSTVINNTAPYGGGIGNLGSTSVTNSTISSNSGNTGGGIFNYNGSGTLILENSAVINNIANEGGGISNFNGKVILTNVMISENTAQVVGGILQEFGELILNNSSVDSNVATKFYVTGGGGIRSGASSILTITNTTISSNITNNLGGSGIENFGTMTLSNATIYGNSGSTDAPGFRNLGTANIKNSLIAGNNGPSIFGQDCYGTINSQGYNLIQDTTSCIIIGDTIGNIHGVNPMLGPLQNNSGPTLTHALLPGSPAIDAGNPAGCTDQDGNLLSVDQRGISRPQGGVCDIGAYEYVATFEVSIDIKPESDTNPINPNSNGNIPVAILSTPDFDAPSMVDISSLTFGRTGDEESLAFCNKNGEDVNSDGLLDLMCHFDNQLSVLVHPKYRYGNLLGYTVDGTHLKGRDAITIIY